MCGSCQMWVFWMMRVWTWRLSMGGVRGVAVVHSVIHVKVPVRRAPIGSVHHSGRQGPSWGCECGFNFGKFGFESVTTDTSSLIDSLRGSEPQPKHDPSAHPSYTDPRPDLRWFKRTLSPSLSTNLLHFSSHKHYTLSCRTLHSLTHTEHLKFNS